MHESELHAALQEVDFNPPQGEMEFSKGQLVDIIWALAKASHWTPKLEAATVRLSKRGGLPSLQPFMVVKLLWALAVLYYAPPALFSRASQQLRGVILPHAGS